MTQLGVVVVVEIVLMVDVGLVGVKIRMGILVEVKLRFWLIVPLSRILIVPVVAGCTAKLGI